MVKEEKNEEKETPKTKEYKNTTSDKGITLAEYTRTMKPHVAGFFTKNSGFDNVTKYTKSELDKKKKELLEVKIYGKE